MGSGSSGADSGRRLALATCAEVAELDPEGRLLLERCREAGLAAEPVVWDDPDVAWDRFDRVLIRSTWDYPSKLDAFSRWVAARGSRLLNPPALVGWNLSKRYLVALQRWGFPTVPSVFIAPGEPFEPPNGGEYVVKPAVSAGSRDTGRYAPGEGGRAAAHVGELLADDREVIIQPYLESVDVEAETALIVLGGRFSHAMRKGPLLELDQDLERGLFRAEEMAPRIADPGEVQLAEALLARLSAELQAPTYARVDLLRSAEGDPLILELELIEPSLFLDHQPAAADRLIELLAASLADAG